jgi:hypothetical protein
MLHEKCIEYFHGLSQESSCNKSYSTEKQKYWIEYIIGGLFNILIEWARGGMKQSDNYMADIVTEFINN